ncbi:unnamed protein product [Somion occarium]|uniref:N-acetyltransferase domain-containing protein n=1 Tax=Somion occarium TaxID=3059160 RepID=A0ABP1D0H3_9APHY
MTSQLYIRPARQSDSATLSRICLLTAEAGVSAEHLHTFGELPGVIYAEPYVHLPFAGGFVLVDRSKSSSASLHDDDNNEEEGGEVVGYALSAFDTPRFEQELEKRWFPKYRIKYPLSLPDFPVPVSTSSPLVVAAAAPKEADIRYINNIHNPPHASPGALVFSLAHMHIDILPEYQKLGYGRKLIDTLVRWLKKEKGLERLWLGMDKRNVGARRFYEKLGFRDLEGAPEGVVGIEFEDWKG